MGDTQKRRRTSWDSAHREAQKSCEVTWRVSLVELRWQSRDLYIVRWMFETWFTLMGSGWKRGSTLSVSFSLLPFLSLAAMPPGVDGLPWCLPWSTSAYPPVHLYRGGCAVFRLLLLTIQALCPASLLAHCPARLLVGSPSSCFSCSCCCGPLILPQAAAKHRWNLPRLERKPVLLRLESRHEVPQHPACVTGYPWW